MVAQILVELKAKNINQTFTYLIPNHLIDKIKIGIRVIVPFGHQKLEGFVIDIIDNYNSDYKLKEIISCVDETPILNKEMLELGNYISKKTLCNLISAYQTMLPAALKAKKGFYVNKKYVTYLNLIDKDYKAKNDKQKNIIELLNNSLVLKSEATKISLSGVNTLIKNGVIEEIKKEQYRLDEEVIKESNKVKLTSNQEKVVNEVTQNLNTFKPFLLHGVTGSGKTEVYMNIIDNVLKNKKEAIVLVPEISLTPQMVNVFKNRFGKSIAILHSRLSDGEKYDEWRKIEKKEVSIVIGARSAIFAPLTNIGIIIVDEEHTDTYKQENNPKYNAIDIAIKRAKTHNCPVLLGSATPSIESYTRAKQGIYKLLELPNRINNQMPEVKLIDMALELKKGNKVFSQELKDDINDRLKKNEQIIILLNRRGYSTTISCKNCGETIKCPNCDIPLTYHKNGNKMNCHYCNYTTYKPKECPSCKSEDINSYGIGTEKLQEEIENMFPNAKTIRMDIDTTSRKGSLERIVTSFREKKYNILIGTQMISKGLDFEDVTLVGVINGDASLNIPDYRSAERTYDLLNQVAGRSGRSSKKGKVIIQGFNINHYSIVTASSNDYEGFYKKEMDIRKKLGYPPYYNLCVIKIICKNDIICIEEANKIKKYLDRRLNRTNIILGPSFSNIPKLNNNYYMQIIIKFKNTKEIIEKLNFILNKYNSKKNIKIDIDINPKKI